MSLSKFIKLLILTSCNLMYKKVNLPSYLVEENSIISLVGYLIGGPKSKLMWDIRWQISRAALRCWLPSKKWGSTKTNISWMLTYGSKFLPRKMNEHISVWDFICWDTYVYPWSILAIWKNRKWWSNQVASELRTQYAVVGAAAGLVISAARHGQEAEEVEGPRRRRD